MFEQEFTARIGFKVPVEGQFGGAERERDVYVSQLGMSVKEYQQRAQIVPLSIARQENLVPPWKWIPEGYNIAPQTIKAIYPGLLERRAQRRHRVAETLSNFEETSIRGLRVANVETGEAHSLNSNLVMFLIKKLYER